MTTLTRFRVLGKPAPQGSKRGFISGGKVRLVESAGDSHKAWRHAVADEANRTWAGQPPIVDPVEIAITFHLPRPKTAAKRAVWAAKRPDLDKLIRSTLDALSDAGVLTDDALVVRLIAVKRLASIDQSWTGASITIARPSEWAEVAEPQHWTDTKAAS